MKYAISALFIVTSENEFPFADISIEKLNCYINKAITTYVFVK